VDLARRVALIAAVITLLIVDRAPASQPEPAIEGSTM